MGMVSAVPTTYATPNDLLWAPAAGPSSIEEIERIPLEQRRLSESTYELVAGAARLWPDRPAASVLPDGEHWQTPVPRTFAELAGDVHRAAGALHELGVGRGDAAVADRVSAALVDGQVEVQVPHSPADAEAGETLSQYAWRWRLV
jgi:fatty-acyl-CoA synthase